MYDHILVALDGSTRAEQVLPHVEALAGQFGARVTLLRATRPVESIVAETTDRRTVVAVAFFDPSPVMDAEQAEAGVYLEDVAVRFRSMGLAVDVQHPARRSADAIIGLARDLSVNIIAMTTHGRTGLKRALLGSVADEVVRNAGCPVLLVCAR